MDIASHVSVSLPETGMPETNLIQLLPPLTLSGAEVYSMGTLVNVLCCAYTQGI